jgi:triosephosphate isomerase
LKEAFKDTDINVGAQNMHFAENGANTGEVSAGYAQRARCGILHHRPFGTRQYFNETDETLTRSFIPHSNITLFRFLCVGEPWNSGIAGKEFDVVQTQTVAALKGLTAEQTASLGDAYEPVWPSVRTQRDSGTGK